MSYYTLVTTVGHAKMANAIALGSAVSLTHMALGDGNGAAVTPTETMTALTREVYRAPLNTLSVDPAQPGWLIAEMVVPADVGGWTVREAALIASDGTVFAVANFPETYKPVIVEGSTRELVVRITVEVTNVNSVQLVIDPTIVLATRQYADEKHRWRQLVAGAVLKHGDKLLAANGSGPVSYTLPAAPVDGDAIEFAEGPASFGLNALTLQRNGKTIMGLSEDMTVTTDRAVGRLIWSAAANTWRVYSTGRAGAV